MANIYPEPIPQPFGINGDRSPIVNTPEANVPSWPLGYPPNFSIPLPDGAQIERKEWNQLLYILSANQFWQQSGQLPTFDPKIGKYPKGALLWVIPPDGVQRKTAGYFDPWCHLNLMYNFDTDVIRYPVPVISIVDDNDFNFNGTPDEQDTAFLEGWRIIDGSLIEKSSIVPPATINNVSGNITSVVYARENVIDSRNPMYPEITTSLIVEPPAGYQFIKTVLVPGVNLYAVSGNLTSGLTQIEALFPYWLQSMLRALGPEHLISAKMFPFSYPAPAAGVWPLFKEMPIHFTPGTTERPFFASWAANIIAANMSAPINFKLEIKYRIN